MVKDQGRSIEGLPIFKFALYGRKSSGKTCHILALILGGIPHRRGATCTWIRDSSQAQKAVGDNSEEAARAFGEGRRFLEEAVYRLEAGDLPEANPPQNPLRLLFLVTTPWRHRYFVELLDYSGELLEVRGISSDLASKLRAMLATVDGLMVLAEVPRADANTETMTVELNLLREAFATLTASDPKARIHDLPVVLLVNKWDRFRGNLLNHDDPREERRVLRDEFMPRRYAHRALHDAIRGGTDPRNMITLPVSAFGHAADREIQKAGKLEKLEIPETVHPLPSFGMLDPLLWLAERRARSQLSAFDRLAIARSAWSPSLLFRGVQAGLPVAALRKIWRGRAPQLRRVETSLRRLHRARLYQAGAVALAGVLLPPVGIAMFDARHVSELRRIEADPAASVEAMGEATAWLADYAAPSPYWRALSHHAVLSPNAAKASLEQVEQRRVEAEFHQKAAAFLDQSRRTIAATRGALETNDLSSMEYGQARDQLETVLATAPRVLTGLQNEPLAGDIGAIRNELEALIAKGSERFAKAQVSEALARVQTMMQGIETLPQAADELAALDETIPEVQAAQGTFPRRMIETARQQVESLLREGHHEDAARAVLALRQSAGVTELLDRHPDALHALDTLANDIGIDLDRQRYEVVRAVAGNFDPTLDPTAAKSAISDYLAQRDPQMRAEVDKFRLYVEKFDQPVQVQLRLTRVTLSEPNKSTRHYIDILVSGDRKIYVYQDSADRKWSENFSEDREISVFSREKISIASSISAEKTILGWDDPLKLTGSIQNIRIEDLRNSITLSLDQQNDTRTGSVTLVLDGLEKGFPMPGWSPGE